jgi:predicted lactoylglutathione lyase
MTTKMFINLPVKDLDRTKVFFSKLGFSYDPRFTDEKAACMIINQDGYVMLLSEPFFKTFTRKKVADARKSAEVLNTISADSREQVNEILKTALDNGARESMEPQDNGYMYGRSFDDLDGHTWEVMWMDMEAFSRAQNRPS